ncbi:MAG: hypothetical protein ABSE70_10855 [Candidatus Limnocylindrales bacterium]
MDGSEDEVSPAEAARERRRDRDAAARARAGMRTGLAKQFKQVLDSQTKRAQEAEWPARDGHEPRGDADEEEHSRRARHSPPRRKP